MPGFAAEFRRLTYFTLCHSLADIMSLKRGGSPPPYTLSAVTSYMHPGARPGTHDTRARTTPRREESATGCALHNGAYEVLWVQGYRCGHRIKAPNQGTGFRTQGRRYRRTSFPAWTASDRSRNRNRRAPTRRRPEGRQWPPPDRPAPRPRRTPSYRPRSRSHPPQPHAEWSPR